MYKRHNGKEKGQWAEVILLDRALLLNATKNKRQGAYRIVPQGIRTRRRIYRRGEGSQWTAEGRASREISL